MFISFLKLAQKCIYFVRFPQMFLPKQHLRTILRHVIPIWDLCCLVNHELFFRFVQERWNRSHFMHQTKIKCPFLVGSSIQSTLYAKWAFFFRLKNDPFSLIYIENLWLIAGHKLWKFVFVGLRRHENGSRVEIYVNQLMEIIKHSNGRCRLEQIWENL